MLVFYSQTSNCHLANSLIHNSIWFRGLNNELKKPYCIITARVKTDSTSGVLKWLFFMSKFLILFLLCSAWSQVVVAQDSLRFLIGDYPLYTYQENGQTKGIAYDAVAAIMTQMQQPFSVKLVPSFGRAIVDIRQNTADGFFLATENEERNVLAEFSEPVLSVQWTWVWLRQRTDLDPGSAEFKQQAQVSAHANSNIHQWLTEHNYQVTPGTVDIRGLLSLLKFNRVDAILLPQLTIDTLMQQQGVDATLYNLKPEVKLPFAIYISKTYLKKHPQFMQQLNAAIRRYHAQVHDEQPL